MAEIRYTSAGGVVIHADSMLLLDRPKRNEVRLPKGHIDPGETGEEAALRETMEETGYSDLEIIADLGSQLVEFDHDGDHYIRTEIYFLMRLKSQQQKPRPAEDEVQFRILWTPLDEAISKLTFCAEKRVAQKALEIYQLSS